MWYIVTSFAVYYSHGGFNVISCYLDSNCGKRSLQRTWCPGASQDHNQSLLRAASVEVHHNIADHNAIISKQFYSNRAQQGSRSKNTIHFLLRKLDF